MSERAIDIEKLSFEIIDAEIGSHGYSELEWPIVRRVIHATADFDFARKGKIIFNNNPIDSAFDAIKNKCNIVTDVDMVLSALNKKSIADLGLKSACYISDKTLSDKARLYNKTRSEMAMRYAADEINGGIVAIGNAPTALYEIIKMVRENVTKPALIVGIPVGLVGGCEWKDGGGEIGSAGMGKVGREGGRRAAAGVVDA